MSVRVVKMTIRPVRESTMTCKADEKNPHLITVKKAYVFENTDKAYAICPVHYELVPVNFRPFVFPCGRENRRTNNGPDV